MVLESKSVLEKVREENFWANITEDKLEFLRKDVAPILRARHGIDFKSMRFEVDITDLATANILANSEAVEVLKENIVEQVSELPLTINTVNKEKDFIEEIQSNKFWSTVQEEKLYEAVKRLAPLMRFRETIKGGIEKLHLEDIITKKEWVEFGPEHERLTTFAYRERVEKLIKSLKDKNPILQKIASGEEVEEWEIEELEKILQKYEPYVTEQLLQRVYDNQSATFIQFMRHILGLEKLSTWSEEVTLKFDRFITEHNNFYTSKQVQFLEALKLFILQTKDIEKKDLISPPFTQFHSRGIQGLFTPSEIAEIYAFSEQFRTVAVA